MRNLILFAITIFLACLLSCTKSNTNNTNNTTPSIPRIATVGAGDLSGITQTGATINAAIISDGGSEITAKGVCWSVNHNPTITNSLMNKTDNDTGSANFIAYVTGLNPSTTYYLRVYATNSIGTGYSNEISFTTTFYKDISGYFQGKHTVQIRRYYWQMYSPYVTGDTTFTDTIEFIKSGVDIIFKYPDDNIDKLLLFAYTDSVSHKDIFENHPPSLGQLCELFLDYTTDSIYLENKDGGLGGGRKWDINGKK